MNTGMYAIASALQSRFQAQDSIARNIAHSTAIGYRREIPAFYGFGTALFEAQSTSDNEPATASGVQFLQPTHNWEPGDTWRTEAPLDFQIQGEGFFAIGTPEGEFLTRDGHFQRQQDGALVTADGKPVLGNSGGIKLPEKGEVTLRADGTLEVDNAVFDKLRIVVPSSYDDLAAASGSSFRHTGSEAPKVLAAPKVSQGSLERSNTNIMSEMVTMIENSRATEMASKAMQVVDQGFSDAIRAFSS